MSTYPTLPQGNFQGYQNAPGGIPPAYQTQPGYPPQSGIPSSGYPPQSGIPSSGYPPQSGIPSPGYPPQSGIPSHGYPSQSPYSPPPATSPGYQTQAPATSGPPPSVGFLPQNMPPAAYAQESHGAEDDDNHVPSAPPLTEMEKHPGYEHVTFDSVALSPPTHVDRQKEPPPERSDLGRLPVISEEQVREALIQHASEHCCYGKAPANEMVVRDVQMSSAFHYTLETFGEKRETAWVFEPYSGQQPLDTAMNGPAPAPWEVLVLPQTYFQDAVAKVEVPHTAVARPCHTCVGIGRMRCKGCQGNGQTRCTSCKNGMRDEGQCTWCSGSGHNRCFRCSGTGQVKCKTCSGKCNLKCFVQLTVTWKNHLEDFISDKVSLPDDCIRKVSGQVAFEEKHQRVWPINHSPDQKINQASSNLVQSHSQSFPQERILQQRHNVRIVPIAEVSYSWKSHEGTFFVFGFENKVYFPDYPQKCCCGCVIL